jgi:hypothetical protein
MTGKSIGRDAGTIFLGADWLIAPVLSFNREAFPKLQLLAVFSKAFPETNRVLKQAHVTLFKPHVSLRAALPLGAGSLPGLFCEKIFCLKEFFDGANIGN